ncbi:flagellar hook-basal body complex protein FliE [Lysobacter gummosus]|jgi:flagellar hook-basal body complex protein FliE|uniref:Flagellar hook-basal body complex protein FliE n=1 Tax=Lysobacter gummosus TaxID=262324 RepID=A0ABY3XCK2_9GAMM|nr:flagellar hook-basal body complex protein FliE [Lysobacter gummosus]ALN93524.1 flagellar hook-basal body complex protein FliE [Lysobacter gummosus]UNP28972.1 flagellar hook-basal body complex protein FliE [Lysobacter gummosus]
MSIDALAALMSAQSAGAVAPSLAPATAAPPAQSFGSMLLANVMHADNSVQAAEKAVESFALDGRTPPHQVMIALEEARMSLHYALQVRNRLVEGYQELMRMQL